MKNISAVILAAGEGTRMNSNVPKILHRLGSKPMLGHVIDNVQAAGIKDIFIITGFKSQMVEKYVGNTAKCVQQKKLLGTADAVWQIRNEKALKEKNSKLLIIYGDTPLIQASTIKDLIKKHYSEDVTGTLLSVNTKDPSGYGRIVRSDGGKVVKIVEEQEASVYERAIEEINVGVYVFKVDKLLKAIEKIRPNNRKKEYYLTDVVQVLHKDNQTVNAIETQNYNEILGVNSRFSLAEAYEIFRMRILDKIIASGVTVLDPKTTYIDEKVTIGRDTIIYPCTVIEGNVIIGENCSIGPFARIRSESKIANGAIVGNFVEFNRSEAGENSRIKHQSYIGDTKIGKAVNVGAGTIVANYDGKNKNKTIIQDGAFIGSGTILVAPVKMGKNAVTGAGAVVTKNKNIPANTVVVGIPAKVFKKIKSS